MNHLRYLEDQRLTTDTGCALLAGKLAENALLQNKTSPHLRPLGNLALALLSSSLEVTRRIPLTDESTVGLGKNHEGVGKYVHGKILYCMYL